MCDYKYEKKIWIILYDYCYPLSNNVSPRGMQVYAQFCMGVIIKMAKFELYFMTIELSGSPNSVY